MSGASTWLHSQRKAELVSLAEKVGLEDCEGLKKIELEMALDEYMRANQSRLSKDSSLAAFYRRIATPSSPVKRESSVAVVVGDDSKKPRARRTTRARDDIEPTDDSEFEPSKSLATRSPRTSLSFASTVPLPPSPSVVVDKIDQQAANVRNTLDALWDQSGISQFSDSLRDKLSNTAIIETLALVLEIYGLRHAILPFKYFGMIPSYHFLNTSTPKLDLQVPDLFALLDPVFWSTSSLWFTTSVLLPLTFAYYFNFTRKAKRGPSRHTKASSVGAQYDMLTFNIAKALIA
ncbi:MAG: hypothetical protein Q9187_003651, partial [Circinaria calcarea]